MTVALELTAYIISCPLTPQPSDRLQVVAARNYAVRNILPVKGVLDHAMYDCGAL